MIESSTMSAMRALRAGRRLLQGSARLRSSTLRPHREPTRPEPASRCAAPGPCVSSGRPMSENEGPAPEPRVHCPRCGKRFRVDPAGARGEGGGRPGPLLGLPAPTSGCAARRPARSRSWTPARPASRADATPRLGTRRRKRRPPGPSKRAGRLTTPGRGPALRDGRADVRSRGRRAHRSLRGRRPARARRHGRRVPGLRSGGQPARRAQGAVGRRATRPIAVASAARSRCRATSSTRTSCRSSTRERAGARATSRWSSCADPFDLGRARRALRNAALAAKDPYLRPGVHAPRARAARAAPRVPGHPPRQRARRRAPPRPEAGERAAWIATGCAPS